MEFIKDKSLHLKQRNLMDNLFFLKTVEDKEAAEELIQLLICNKRVKIIENQSNKSLINIENRSVALDLYCVDEEGKEYNIEVQRTKKDNAEEPTKRMRYNISMMDTHTIEKGIKAKDLPEIYGIMISEFDPFGEGRLRYEIKRKIENSGKKTDNGIHEIYVFTRGKGDSDLKELVEFFENSNGYNEKFPKLSKRVMYLKEDEKGMNEYLLTEEEFLAWAEKEGLKKGMKEGLKEGRKEGRNNTFLLVVKNMKSLNYTISQIMEATGLSEKEIESLTV